jgi:hypothetical protein
MAPFSPMQGPELQLRGCLALRRAPSHYIRGSDIMASSALALKNTWRGGEEAVVALILSLDDHAFSKSCNSKSGDAEPWRIATATPEATTMAAIICNGSNDNT